jgi:hypothetical protein
LVNPILNSDIIKGPHEDLKKQLIELEKYWTKSTTLSYLNWGELQHSIKKTKMEKEKEKLIIQDEKSSFKHK